MENWLRHQNRAVTLWMDQQELAFMTELKRHVEQASFSLEQEHAERVRALELTVTELRATLEAQAGQALLQWKHLSSEEVMERLRYERDRHRYEMELNNPMPKRKEEAPHIPEKLVKEAIEPREGAAFSCRLWKLNEAEFDEPEVFEHYCMRDVWIGKSGALYYYSLKENGPRYFFDRTS